MADLVSRLAEAAAESIRARTAAIVDGGPGNLRSVTVELEIANNGAVLDVRSFLEWKRKIRSET